MIGISNIKNITLSRIIFFCIRWS